MPTWSTVSCAEVHGTASEDWSNESGIQASVQLDCLASDKNDLILDLLSTPRPFAHLSSLTKPPTAFRVTAVPRPHSADTDIDEQVYSWTDYRLTVQYTTDPRRTVFSERIEPQAEFQRLDHRYFRWASGAPLTDAEAPGLLKRSLNFVRQFYNMPSVPAAILSGVGCVHNGPVTSTELGLTFPAETLLFLPNPIETTVTTGGTTGYNYTLKFAYKPGGWNKFYRPSTNTYESIYNLAGTVVKPYPPADLSSLLP